MGASRQFVPAPHDLGGLRKLHIAASRGNGGPSLGPRAQDALGRMLESPRQAAVSSISELAAQLQVNASTLSRLAQALGYTGFAELQDVFRRHFAATGRYYSDKAERLQRGEEAAAAALALAGRVARDEQDNISRMLRALGPATLEEAASLLVTAGKVRALGRRQSASLASYFTYCLGMVRECAALLADPEHGAAHGLAQLTRGDVLVVFGFAPYTRETVAATQIAASRGLQIIAVTDGDDSPLARAATLTFETPTDGVFFSNGMAAGLTLCEILLKLVARKLGDEAVRALERRERLIEAMDVEYGDT